MPFDFCKCIMTLCESKQNMNINENNDVKNDILSKLQILETHPIIERINHAKGINAARDIAQKSLSNKRKVGCVIIDNEKIVSSGYNQVPNCIKNKNCEENNKTYWYVLHAEADAILKLINENVTLNNPIMYITLSPCKECAKLILQSGIKTVIYDEEYKHNESLELLRCAGVYTEKYKSISSI